MKRIIIGVLTLINCFSLAGCRWADDFRDRQQPQPLEQPLRPTLNPESIDYAGNPLKEEAEEEKDAKLPAIDAVSKIPEVPEYPAGI